MTTQEVGWVIDQPRPKPETLGERLLELREEFGLSSDTAATACAVGDGQSWRNWERGVEIKANVLAKIVCRFESRDANQAALLAYLTFGGEKPDRPQPGSPFLKSVTGRNSVPPKRRGKTATRRNTAYCSLHSGVKDGMAPVAA